jgi:hypothetical protein
MIYCVVPKALADELYPRLSEYYADDPNVTVIIDRRGQGGTPGTHEAFEDRRRKRPSGSFPKIEPPSGG